MEVLIKKKTDVSLHFLNMSLAPFFSDFLPLYSSLHMHEFLSNKENIMPLKLRHDVENDVGAPMSEYRTMTYNLCNSLNIPIPCDKDIIWLIHTSMFISTSQKQTTRTCML